MFLDFAKHRFDVNYRAAVEGFDWTDSQALVALLAHGDLMQADRIGPIGRSCRKHPRQSPVRSRAWMALQNLAVRFVQPTQDDDLVTDRQAVEARPCVRMHD